MAFISLFAAGCAVMLPRLGQGTLGLADEGIYASVAWGVLRSGDFLDLSLLGHWWAEKPPLWIWILALSLALLDGSVLAIQLPSALAGVALPCVTYVLARGWFDRLSAWIAGLLVVTFPIVADYGRNGMTDVPLLVLFTLALLAAYRAADRPAYWIVCGVWTGLAVLLKGMAGVLIPLIIAAAMWVDASRSSHRWSRQDEEASSTSGRGKRSAGFSSPEAMFLGAGLALLIILPWYVHQFLHHGAEMWRVHFGAHVIDRVGLAWRDVLGAGFDPQTSAEYFYVRLLFSPTRALGPWGAVGALALASTLHAAWWREATRHRPLVWTLAWLLLPVWVFWGTHFKNPHYILVVAVPYACLLAGFLVRLIRETDAAWSLLAVLALGAVNLGLETPVRLLSRSAFFDGVLVGLLLLAVREVVARAVGRCVAQRGYSAVMAGILAVAAGVSVGPPRVCDRYPGVEALRNIALSCKAPETQTVMVGTGIVGEMLLYPAGFEWLPAPDVVWPVLGGSAPALAVLPFDLLATRPSGFRGRFPILATTAVGEQDVWVLLSNDPAGTAGRCLYVPSGNLPDSAFPHMAVRPLETLAATNAVIASVSDAFSLVAVRAEPACVRRGGWIQVQATWRCEQRMRLGATQIVRLVSLADGRSVVVLRSRLLDGAIDWGDLAPGWVVSDTQWLRVPFDCARGSYRVELALEATPENGADARFLAVVAEPGITVR